MELVRWARIRIGLFGSLLQCTRDADHRRGTPIQGRVTVLRAARASVLAAALCGALLSVGAAVPAPATAQGWWGGPPAGTGFDRNTVIQVTGIAAQVSLRPPRGPARLQVQASGETYTVMLGPGWYAQELNLDIQEGDPVSVEGSKLMDRQGHLHLIAARVTNRRTGRVVELRDEMGRPRWRDARP
jgi:hypothetical protein